MYKLVVKDRAIYGTPVDDKHFRMCNGMVIERPNGARVEHAGGTCPNDDGPFVPHAGHGKLKLPKPSPKPP